MSLGSIDMSSEEGSKPQFDSFLESSTNFGFISPRDLRKASPNTAQMTQRNDQSNHNLLLHDCAAGDSKSSLPGVETNLKSAQKTFRNNNPFA